MHIYSSVQYFHQSFDLSLRSFICLSLYLFFYKSIHGFCMFLKKSLRNVYLYIFQLDQKMKQKIFNFESGEIYRLWEQVCKRTERINHFTRWSSLYDYIYVFTKPTKGWKTEKRFDGARNQIFHSTCFLFEGENKKKKIVSLWTWLVLLSASIRTPLDVTVGVSVTTKQLPVCCRSVWK